CTWLKPTFSWDHPGIPSSVVTAVAEELIRSAGTKLSIQQQRFEYERDYYEKHPNAKPIDMRTEYKIAHPEDDQVEAKDFNNARQWARGLAKVSPKTD
ncbi:MAG: hypothetical protein KDA60_15365, partial [Planctomycetales bacterium]|nr:hypothetical protein [Planctomycetales bacterium]